MNIAENQPTETKQPSAETVRAAGEACAKSLSETVGQAELVLSMRDARGEKPPWDTVLDEYVRNAHAALELARAANLIPKE